MSDLIEQIGDREDTVKTEYRIVEDGDEKHIEMWHDLDRMKDVFDKAINGHTSQKGLLQFAKERAIAVRETRIDEMSEPVRSTMREQLKEVHAQDECQDYEYSRNS